MTEYDDRGFVPRGDERIIFSGDGEWHVYEYRSRLYENKPPVLAFEQLTTIRVVRDYPANWRALDDEQLLALSERR